MATLFRIKNLRYQSAINVTAGIVFRAASIPDINFRNLVIVYIDIFYMSSIIQRDEVSVALAMVR